MCQIKTFENRITIYFNFFLKKYEVLAIKR